MMTQYEAEAAGRWHLQAVADGALNTGKSRGRVAGWRWWFGATRAVWLPPGSDTVFKIEKMQFGLSNVEEHRKISEWRRQQFPWAPETRLFTVNCPGLTSPTVLAMPYYPCPVPAADIPRSALERVDDSLPANFARKSKSAQVMLIDAG